MRRLRLASLVLASTLLLTLAGCTSMSNPCCDDGGGRWFGRLFNRSSSSPMNGGMYGGPDCECNRPGLFHGTSMPSGQGPFLMPSTQGATTTTPIVAVNGVTTGQNEKDVC